MEILSRKSPYSVQMRENTDQKNSKYGHFSRSVRINGKKTYNEIILQLQPSRHLLAQN